MFADALAAFGVSGEGFKDYFEIIALKMTTLFLTNLRTVLATP
jgi:hypothetical protein